MNHIILKKARRPASQLNTKLTRPHQGDQEMGTAIMLVLCPDPFSIGGCARDYTIMHS